jgi:hypothetical protein
VLAAGHLDALVRRDPVPAEVVPAGLLDVLAQVPDLTWAMNLGSRLD